MRFQASVGNPPYNDSGDIKSTIYHKFVRKSSEISESTTVIVPSRWAKAAGQPCITEFRRWMLKEAEVKFLLILRGNCGFRGVDIEGYSVIGLQEDCCDTPTVVNGVEHVDYGSFDVFVEPRFHTIAEKLVNFTKEHGSMSDVFVGSHFYGLRTNPKTLGAGSVPCLVSKLKSDSRVEVLQASSVGTNIHKRFWKVVTPLASGRQLASIANTLLVSPPEQIYSGSYVAFKAADEREAHNMRTYLNTKFASFALWLRKLVRNITKRNVKWIPRLDFSEPWSDSKLRARNPFGFTDDEWYMVLNS